MNVMLRNFTTGQTCIGEAYPRKFAIFLVFLAISSRGGNRVPLVRRCWCKATYVSWISLSEVESGKQRKIRTWHRLRCHRWSAPRPRWTPNWMSSKSTCWRHENSVSVPVSSPPKLAISGDLKRENYISAAFLYAVARQSIY